MKRCRSYLSTIADSPRSLLLAARAHCAYRSRGGTRQMILSGMSDRCPCGWIERCELLMRECPGLSQVFLCCSSSSLISSQHRQSEVASTF